MPCSSTGGEVVLCLVNNSLRVMGCNKTVTGALAACVCWFKLGACREVPIGPPRLILRDKREKQEDHHHQHSGRKM
ncbi:hypothetical protein O3P69_005085 [Scylla paramamosain]|uniref:Uncharacterized protein n=1 Tax=Scylla paramamosain TaxID=85552 RepID=A0AAW0UA08_SCYPA